MSLSPRKRDDEDNSHFNVLSWKVNFDSIPEAEFIRGKYHLVPKELPGAVWRYNVIDEKYWYWDERGAGLYISLIQSPHYRVLSENFNLLQRHVGEIVKIVTSNFKNKKQKEIEPFDFVAFGVGSADKELLMLDSLMRHTLTLTENREKIINYIPADISFPLLSNSLRALLSSKTLREYIKNRVLDLTPILTDFFMIPKEILGKNKNKFIAALGVVWNAPIPDIFNALRELMDRESLLLIDVEFIGDRTDDDIKYSYENDESNSFFYHPLELLYEGSSTGEKFEVTTSRGTQIKDYKLFNNFAIEFGDIGPTIVTSKNIDSFINEHNLPEEAKEKIRISPSEKSKTVVILYKQKPNVPKIDKTSTIVLGYSTRFDYDDFIEQLHKANLEIVKSFCNGETPRKSTFAYFLLKIGSGKKKGVSNYKVSTTKEWNQDEIKRIFEEKKYSVTFNKIIREQEFDIVAEKTKWGKENMIVCRLTTGKLNDDIINKFIESVIEARKNYGYMKDAIIFSEETIDEEIYNKYVRQKNYPSSNDFNLKIFYEEKELEKF